MAHPADPLRAIPGALRAQWEAFLATPCPVLRWVLEPGEADWVDTFLRGRLGGGTTVVLWEGEGPAGRALAQHGFALLDPFRGTLLKARVPRLGRWEPVALSSGLRDTEALAGLLGSFARHVEGSAIPHVAVALLPTSMADLRGYREWLVAFLTSLVRYAPGVRVVLLDDTKQPAYQGLASDAVVHTVHASLELPVRMRAMVEASVDPASVEGRLRLGALHVVALVQAGRVDEAQQSAHQLDAFARDVGANTTVVPVHFAVGAGLVAAGRQNDAVKAYRAAESAAERGVLQGDPTAARLRVFARFGAGSALLATPVGRSLAAKHYAETAPLCEPLGDRSLELEAHRCAATAHELAGAQQAAFDECVKALALVDRMSEVERAGAPLVLLVDLIVRLVQVRDLAGYQSAMHTQLRRRGLRGTTWA
jgi:hypothetical protein